MPLLLEIVTPEKKVYSETVDTVYLPTQNGEIGILPGHIPLLTVIEPGELRMEKEGGTEYLAVDKGFVQIHGDKVSVLTEQAIDVQEIDETAAKQARENAIAELEKARKSGEDPAVLEQLEAQARFSVVQRLLKEKQRSTR